jgi:ABC-type lipoprotein release transport system permease subunit
MAIGMAVITGALVVGDSVRSGLKNLVGIRLGEADLSVSAGDRYLTDSLAIRMSAELEIPSAAVLQLQGSVSAGGGTIRIPKIQVYGIDVPFQQVLSGETFDPSMADNEAVISDNLAVRLAVKVGDEILVRISKPGPVPIDAPFVSDADQIVTTRLTVRLIAGKDQHGRFHLQNTQTAPFNVFVGKKYLQKLAGLDGFSNRILLAGGGKVSAQRVEESLAANRALSDAGLHLDRHPITGEWIIRTPRVFFDLPTLTAIESMSGEKSLWFSYFVNEFRTSERKTPYSFVSTLPGDQVKPGEILINRWLADDLEAKTGDSVTLSFFMVGPLRNLTVKKIGFRISGIIQMEDPRCDRLLMPEIPGLSDAGNCRDWETSIPINLKDIRDKDERYWNQYHGTPKAFINPGQAAALWQNRFGKYTQIRLPPSANPADIQKSILNHLRPSDIGITVSEPSREGITAASSGVDFSGLFLGLSFFLIAGGIILTYLLIRLGLEGRLTQIGILKALGWPEKRIRQSLLAEYSLIALIGVAMGLILTYFYTVLIFRGLNGVWNEIVLTDTLKPVFKPGTLVMGALLSLVVSSGTAWLTIKRFFTGKTSQMLRLSYRNYSSSKKKILPYVFGITGIISLGMALYGLFRFQSTGPTFFFAAGTLMLLSFIVLAIKIFKYDPPKPAQNLTLASLGNSNLYRNSNRSLSVVLLFSIGVFMVIAIGANRKTTGFSVETDHNLSLQKANGTGGFLFYMETTVPVPDNLNDPTVRARYGLETRSEFVQMKRLEGDDASCLNLNRVTNPPLLGVPSGAFSGRFRFISLADKKFSADPWKLLDRKLSPGCIPGVADQTVIQWGLGLKIGDTLKYKSENGDTVNIVLAGGLENSVFQGNILIPEDLFTQHWPSVSGTQTMLIDADPDKSEVIHSEVLNVFRDYGTELKPAVQKLAEFNAIENTYLSIFLVMGALAMLLGTIGLAIILARNLQERRAEIALYRAMGFSRSRIFRLVIREYSTLLFYGTLAGGISALISVLPGLFNPSGQVSPVYLISILLILIVNGLVWIVLLGWVMVRKAGVVQNLRTEE